MALGYPTFRAKAAASRRLRRADVSDDRRRRWRRSGRNDSDLTTADGLRRGDGRLPATAVDVLGGAEGASDGRMVVRFATSLRERL